MKKKIFAILALVLVLAMESVTVFATDSITSRTEEVSGNNDSDSDNDDTDTTPTTTTTTTTTNQAVAGPDGNLTQSGDVTTTTTTTQTPSYTTEQVKETTKAVDEMTNTKAEDLVKKADVKVEVDEKNNKVVNQTSGKEFEKNIGKVYEYVAPGYNNNKPNSNATGGQGTISSNLVQNDDKYVPQDMTKEKMEQSISVIETMDDIGKKVASNLQSSIFVNIELNESQRDDRDNADRDNGANGGGSSREPIKITDPSAKAGESNLYAGGHVRDDGTIEYRDTWVEKDGVVYMDAPDTFSPIIIVKFDKPVPGLTYTIDYTDSTVTNETVVGAVSPKTDEAEPYKMLALLALITIAGAAIFARKLVK